MFQSMAIIRELVLHLAKVILKPSLNYVVIYCVVMWQHVIDQRVCCVLYRMSSLTIYNDIILLSVLILL